jgi:hypothetical protein
VGVHGKLVVVSQTQPWGFVGLPYAQLGGDGGPAVLLKVTSQTRVPVQAPPGSEAHDPQFCVDGGCATQAQLLLCSVQLPG